MAIQAFDGRSAVLVAPSEIQVDDWMRDCGRLRQVEAIDASVLVGSILVRFSDAPDRDYATLSVPAEGITVTVWRVLAATAAAADAAA